MLNGNFEDKRVFERFPVKFPVRYFQTSYSDTQEGLARAQDISAKGVGLVTKEKLPVNTPLEMWLEIQDKGDPLYARGQVVWSKPAGINEFWSGISLDRADLMGLSRVLRVGQ